VSGPRGSRTSHRGDRFYVWGAGERYWSVTTILKALPKDALRYWAVGVVAAFAYDETANWLGMERSRAIDYLKREPFRYTAGRADLGSTVHGVAEAYALGKPAPAFDTLEERRYVASFLSFAKRLAPKYVLTEAQVFHRTQRYAGTLDAVVDVGIGALLDLGQALPAEWIETGEKNKTGTVRLLLDYKTGKGVYPETALQVNAYARAEFVGLVDGSEAPMPAVDGAAVLHLRADGWDLVPVRLGDDVFRSFLYVREVFRWLEVVSKNVLGERVGVDLDVEQIER